MFAVRGSEFAHQVRFGSGGALIVSLDISGEQFEALDAEEVGRWNPGSQRLVQGVLASVLRRDSRADIEDCVWEVLAGPPSEAALVAPPWLLHARDRLIEESAAIGELAADAGVHRVYFSRAFTRAFGMPPTVYRRRMGGMRAVAAAIEGEAAAASAYDCGFADQSHMSRVLRQVAGTSYKSLRTLNREVTSVQE